MSSPTEATYLLFVFLAAFAFYLCPKRFRWGVLFIASLIFYGIAGSISFYPFIIFTAIIVYSAAILIEWMSTGNGKADAGLQFICQNVHIKKVTLVRLVLITSLTAVVGLLCFTKMLRYMQGMVIHGMTVQMGVFPFLVPLGISYYTFSTVGYLLDVYWKRYSAEKNFLRFLLFVTYFPHIIQGPISRYDRLGTELKKELCPSSKEILFGVERLIWGFFKKLVIADRLNIYLQQVYDGMPHAGSVLLIAVVFDSIMLYMDFSGYMDIMCGVSQMFGIVLEENFRRPFFSRSIPEFWRRWHISLGEWFKDYVYYPFTVWKPFKKFNRHNMRRLPKRIARFLSIMPPTMTTWFLTGLWHGTGRDYILWGIYYGILITLSVTFEPECKQVKHRFHISEDTKAYHIFQMIKVFIIFSGGCLLTREDTKMILRLILTNFQIWRYFDDSLYSFGLSRRDFGLLILCFVLLILVAKRQEKGSIRQMLYKKPVLLQSLLIVLAAFSVLIFGIYGLGYDASSFVYMMY